MTPYLKWVQVQETGWGHRAQQKIGVWSMLYFGLWTLAELEYRSAFTRSQQLRLPV